MNDSPKIQINDMRVSVCPEEIDSILGWRNTFINLEMMGNYISSYLQLGWVIKLVIPHLDVALDVDFRQVREVWHRILTDLAVKGVHPSLMVCTGATSNLLVLEVQGNNSEKALLFGRDWRARCIMQAGGNREQHFFTWPETLSLPDQKVMGTTDILIFGEGGKITLPPSMVPGAEETIRWLTPPWENPPSPPTPRLMEFLEGHFLKEIESRQNEPDIPVWEEIIGQIAPHGRLMQMLLTPQADAESYYLTLLGEARAIGLTDKRLLLGLLWHAPMGEARHDLANLPWLQDLIKGKDQENSSIDMQKLTALMQELSRTLADFDKERQDILKNNFKLPDQNPILPKHMVSQNQSQPLSPKVPGPNSVAETSPKVYPATEDSSLFFVRPTAFPKGEIPVNRKQYEAMIYELGRLNALHKYNSRVSREADLLKAKIEAQRQEEINNLRQLVMAKKTKKWW